MQSTSTTHTSVIYSPIPLKPSIWTSKSVDHKRRAYTPPHTPSPRQILLKRFESETQERSINAHSQDDKFKELERQLTPFDNESFLQEIELIE